MSASMDVSPVSHKIQKALDAMGESLVGQEHVAQRLLMGLILHGHVLLEGLPGLAKTTAVKTLGAIADLAVARIQFTPDLLPADVVGTQVYEPKTSEFRIKRGPIFANLVIADEINRAPAKVQSALLEAMQERQITIGDETLPLDEPFLVLATQNPIEQEGTYSLPEAQLDRFLFKVKVTYGDKEQEKQIMRKHAWDSRMVMPKVISQQDIRDWQNIVKEIYVAENIRDYIVNLVFASRFPDNHGLPGLKNMIAYGASPRASLNLERAARAAALFHGRAYVTPEDVKEIAPDVLRHRILLTYEAEAEQLTTDAVVEKILAHVDVV